MTYDYLLGRAHYFDDPPTFMARARSAPVGPLGEVQALICELFPRVRWLKSGPQAAAVPAPGAGLAVFGSGEPRFLLSLDGRGMVSLISVSRAAPEDALRLARSLGLVVLDEQSQEIFQH